MTTAICIDDNNGMLFFGKRQSRDKAVIADFMKSAGGGKAYIKEFSAKLFEGQNVSVDNNCLKNAGEKDYCFIENEDITPYAAKINKIILYKWNRDYPYDMQFKMPGGFKLQSSTEFKGNSHDKITKEVYVK